MHHTSCMYLWGTSIMKCRSPSPPISVSTPALALNIDRCAAQRVFCSLPRRPKFGVFSSPSSSCFPTCSASDSLLSLLLNQRRAIGKIHQREERVPVDVAVQEAPLMGLGLGAQRMVDDSDEWGEEEEGIDDENDENEVRRCAGCAPDLI